MFQFIRRRLQVKLMLVIALALFIPTALIGAYSINITTSELLRTTDARNLQFVKSQAAAVLQFLAEGERDVLFLSQSSAVRQFVGMLARNSEDTTKTILTSQLKLFLIDYPVYSAVRILDTTGREVAGVDIVDGLPTDVPDSALFLEAAQSYYIEAIRLAGQAYVSDIELNRVGKKIVEPHFPVIRFSLALYAEGGGIVGVIVIKASAEPILRNSARGNEVSYIIDEDGNYLAHPELTKRFGRLLKTGITFQKDYPNDAARIREQGEGTLYSSQDQPDALQAFTSIAIPNRDNTQWIFIFEEKLSDILGKINNARLVIIVLAVVALCVALGFSWVITRNIVQPVRQLAHIASVISRGQWDIPLPTVKSGDEISDLSFAFESMSKELKALYGNLEDRVVARTSELETVAKVSAAAVVILNTDKLLETVTELTETNFSLYHVQIFLIDETGQQLILAASSGEKDQQSLARKRQIPIDAKKSVVAQVARQGKGLMVNDVSAEANFMSNPLLPNTRSEMAIPLIVANKLLGILDLQSDQVNRFTEADLRVMSILGDQIAIAVQNANLYKKQLETSHQLALAQQKAEQASKAKSLFLSNMSHELRTPLNVIIGYTSSMLDRPTMYDNIPLPAIYARDIKLIKDNGYHLIGLINDILDLSKIEAGKLELQLGPTNLIDIFRGVVATSIGLVKDKNIQIKADFPDQLPLVKADGKRVRQIILNLMSNAIKFTENGSVTLHVRVDNQHVQIAVIDTGIGIPEKALSVIFDRFQQIDQEPNMRYGGTGLGLDISKQLCQLHGGDLKVRSVVGQGSIFEFSLPIIKTEATTTDVNTVEGASTSRVFAINENFATAWTVMLIQNDADLSNLLRKTLESDGYLVVATLPSAEVQAMILGVLPDTILLDAHGLDANRQILDALKANEETASIPVILCAGEQAENDLPVGAIAYLSKPFKPEHVLNAVQAIQRHQSSTIAVKGE